MTMNLPRQPNYGAVSGEIAPLVQQRDQDPTILRVITVMLCGIAVGLLYIITLLHVQGHGQVAASPTTTAMLAPPPVLRQTPETAIDFDGSTSNSSVVVLIVYLPDDDGQRQMANYVAKGVESVDGAVAVVQSVTDTTFDQVLHASAVILGSSVENANIHPLLQTWIDEDWDIRQSDEIVASSKIGAAFVTAGGITAGQESTLTSILRAFLIFRFIVVGGEHWTSAFGAAAITHEGPFMEYSQARNEKLFDPTCYVQPNDVIHPLFLSKAQGLGVRVATLAVNIAISIPR